MFWSKSCRWAIRRVDQKSYSESKVELRRDFFKIESNNSLEYTYSMFLHISHFNSQWLYWFLITPASPYLFDENESLSFKQMLLKCYLKTFWLFSTSPSRKIPRCLRSQPKYCPKSYPLRQSRTEDIFLTRSNMKYSKWEKN